ncbi:hypothetical protein [Nodularia sphaerocarpa]|nr:hypothetical protein [Nodularia sphaerocarpa]MDB9374737.1 hypothetical protein [Nodularia sphaerocarpa CS-585]MDB9377141.1 hypothetical protein [Nodularia sphaerocarpa CS-585A2]ULP74892.1 hypothetical protein BDGGKGIB_04563 [Nodularia sphaerocarpa UHCC 0038]
MSRLFTIALRRAETLDGYSFSNSQLLERIKDNLYKVVMKTAIQIKVETN